jgi:hypothetical protein
LILPGRYAQPEPLVLVCSTCDEVFEPGQERAFQKHVYKCAIDNLPAILEAREEQKRRMRIFQPAAWNPDVDAHLAKVGERMLREGRLVMRKSERVRNE